ncbi:MAG: hypothetical protein IJ378_01525 [Alistipes sp.]|nr:hypothetical protein [Alistipes sp.]
MASGLPSKCSFTPSKLRFLGLRPASTDDAEREQSVLTHFAEPRGGKATLAVG